MEQRAFTPATTCHAVVICTGSYCSNTAVPVILKAFLQDHGNQAVKEVLSHHGVAMVEKIPSGGVLIHVRTAEDEEKLAGQEVNLLGRNFKIKRQSFLTNKFFLDVSGIHTVEEANAIFLALYALGVTQPNAIAVAPSTQWVTQGDANTDVDMAKQLETGFKRAEPSFVDENPFEVLDLSDCEFKVVQPKTAQGACAGLVIVPHLKRTDARNGDGPAPTKKRATRQNLSDQDDELTLQEALLLSEHEAQLMVEEASVSSNVQCYHATEQMLRE